MKVLRGELFIDIAWVVVSAWYIGVSMHYPPAGRLIPMVVGIAALVVGVVQLIGNFVPALRPFTHQRNVERVSGDRVSALARNPDALANSPTAETRESMAEMNSTSALRSQATETERSENVRQWTAILWSAGLVAGLFLFGFLVSIPLFFLAYFTLQKNQRNWKLAIVSAIVMGAITFGVFDQLLGLHLYNGLIFTSLAG
ncbi:MAG: tripartite tricarboxylate transporter TctB family protein [Alicyclobacillus herbarius]|uniref:tripartite tricarboxylate transporter TctB family protein n=1 Tax=Alicyclobacillus herbarius TaxID=122960 RepID=UPI002357D48F|nr:tripartite tricarboxylate transporter TctB family protein [Alicyclobacillus herbarius]MCL6633391.1 tripartite tricarboxylate transporter TctB family protein [Alicyclobacillus herbarius]